MTAHHDPELDDVLQDQELIHLSRLLSSAQRSEPPLDEAFRSGLRRQLMKKAWEMGEGRTSFWGRSSGPPVLAWAAAAAGVVLIASVVIYMAQQSPGVLSQLVVNSPMDGANAVRLQQPIMVSFNQPMDHAATEQALHITPATSVTYTWISDTQLSVQPTSGNLAPNTQYQVTIDSNARTAVGQHVAAPSTITFVTQPAATPAPSPSPTAVPSNGSRLTGEHQVAALSGVGTPALLWSADSSTVYFVGAGGKLQVVDLTTGSVNAVAPDGASSPAISPAGDRLAYIRGGNLEVLTFATGTTVELAPTPAATVVGWAKDKLVWGAADGLYTQGAGGPVQLAPLPTGTAVSVVSIAPDGAHAIVQQDQKLVVLELASGNIVQLGQAGARFLGWSADGTRLLYSTSGGTVAADTKNTILATLPQGEPSWSSHDAILIGTDVQLSQIRPDGSARTVLADGTYHGPSWAPNGTTFTFFRGGALWAASAPALPPLPTTLDLAGVVVNSFMQARLQNQADVAMTFLDGNGKQAYGSGGLTLVPPGEPRFSRYYVLTEEVTTRKPDTAVFVVRLVLAHGKLDVSEFEETLTLVRDSAGSQFVIDQATAGPHRDLGRGADVVAVDVSAATIKVTFDSDLNPASVAGGVLVLDDKGKQIDSTVTYANRSVSITGLDLKAGASYKLVVLTTVRDVVGNNVAAEYDLNLIGPAGTEQSTRGGGSATPTPSPTPAPTPS
jgi:hypothetical protein